MSKASTSRNQPDAANFPVPFTIESFRKDIANVFLHHLRTVGWMLDPRTAESLIPGLAEDQNCYELFWEADAEDIGLTYERLRDTTLMKTMEFLYRYAFFGELDASAERMDDESTYTWTSALVYDAANGRLADEWGDNGSFSYQAAGRCLMVCELANARHTLEGGEPFYFKFGSYGKDSVTGFDCLTIRQMALLAGMEEMSIRAAANKTQKRANPLETFSADGGTRIALDVAKEWLKSKGRYVPINVYWSNADIDLATTRFANSIQLWQALYACFKTFAKKVGEDEANARLAQLSITSLISLEIRDLDAQPDLTMKLAEMLDLPGELLVLRCKEVAAREVLQEIEQSLKEILKTKNN